MEVTFDPTLPQNQGIDYAGCDTRLVGKPSKGQDSGKWDEIILPPSAAVNGVLVGNRGIRVKRDGTATPVTILPQGRVSTNGNYVMKCQLDKVPDDVAAIRKAQADAQKADYLTNGPKTRQAPQVPQVPQVPGQAPQAVQAPQVAQAPATDVAAALQAQLEALQAQLAIAQAHQAQAQAPQVPQVPSVPQAGKAPRGKGTASK